ncbi:MAG TPA: MXAN_5187 C-terminal domain-containing protein [Myxococcota bacterium]
MAVVSANKKRLDDLEKTSEAIRRDFDQFFLGLSKRPPTTSQAQLAGVFRKLKEEELKEWNTQDKFRFNQIHARFVTLERIWARTLKQIEDGTYKRDKAKLARKREAEAEAAQNARTLQPDDEAPQRQRGGPIDLDPLDAIDVDMDGFDFDEPKPAPRPVPKPVPRPVAPAPAPISMSGAAINDLGGMSDAKLQQLHKVYVDAKKRTGESSTLTLEALRAQVAKQVPTIRAKHNCEGVDFKVVLKDGKAMLKAIPK